MIKLSEYIVSLFAAGDLAVTSSYDTIGTFTAGSPVALVKKNSVFVPGSIYSHTNSLVITPYSDTIYPLITPKALDSFTNWQDTYRDSVMSLQDPDLEVTAYVDSNYDLLVTTRWTKLSNAGSTGTHTYTPTVIHTSIHPGSATVSICAAPKGSPDYGTFIVAAVVEDLPGEPRGKVFKVSIGSSNTGAVAATLLSSSYTDTYGGEIRTPYLHIDTEIIYRQNTDSYHIVVLHIREPNGQANPRSNVVNSMTNLNSMIVEDLLYPMDTVVNAAVVYITRGYIRRNPLNPSALILVTLEFQNDDFSSGTIRIREIKKRSTSEIGTATTQGHVIKYGAWSSPNSFSVSEVSSKGDLLIGSNNTIGEGVLTLVNIAPVGMAKAADIKVSSHTLGTYQSSYDRSTCVQLSTVDNKSFLFVITDGSSYTKYLRGSIAEDMDISASLLDSYYSPWYDTSIQPGQPSHLLFHSEDVGRFYYGAGLYAQVGKLRESTNEEKLGKLAGFVTSVPTGPTNPIRPPSIIPFAGAVVGEEYYINELGTGITTSVPYIGAPKVAVGLDSSNIQLLKGVFYD